MFTYAWNIAVCTPHTSLLWVIVTVCDTSLCHLSSAAVCMHVSRSVFSTEVGMTHFAMRKKQSSHESSRTSCGCKFVEILISGHKYQNMSAGLSLWAEKSCSASPGLFFIPEICPHRFSSICADKNVNLQWIFNTLLLYYCDTNGFRSEWNLNVKLPSRNFSYFTEDNVFFFLFFVLCRGFLRCQSLSSAFCIVFFWTSCGKSLFCSFMSMKSQLTSKIHLIL